MNRKVIAGILTLCMIIGSFPGMAFAAEGFSDVADTDWYAGAVKYAQEKGLMSGTGNGRFSPKVPTTRGMIVTILWKQAGAPESGTENFSARTDMTKVPDSASISKYAVEAMSWANAMGLINGSKSGNLSPQEPALRGQVAMILYQYNQNVVDKAPAELPLRITVVRIWISVRIPVSLTLPEAVSKPMFITGVLR